MNKRKIDNYIPKAYQALQKTGVVEDGIISNGFHGQIASFGAMVSMGSILSAIALFCRSNKKGDTDRCRLLEAIYYVISDGKTDKVELFNYVKKEIEAGNELKIREMIQEAAVAIKLAMNLYEIKE